MQAGAPDCAESLPARTKNFACASERPTAESFHTFRKRAKELMYQLRILAPLHPLLLQQQVNYLEVLTEHLGNAHDLAFLEQRLIKHSRKGKADRA
ncbi:MAG: CHAD domain-containing protein, partial [Chthoniobacterales bacterium]|nr:CHAD domain-containing protein [Chthoniobacterales bacterium]